MSPFAGNYNLSSGPSGEVGEMVFIMSLNLLNQDGREMHNSL